MNEKWWIEELKGAVNKLKWMELAERASEDESYRFFLFHNFLTSASRDAIKSAEVIRILYTINKSAVLPFLPKMIERLSPELPDAMARAVFWCMQKSAIPEESEGRLLEASLSALSNYARPIAVRVFAMSCAYKLAKKYPDLVPELHDAIRANWDEESTGFKNRGQKILSGKFKF
jgi:hypothetical protein